MCLPGISILLVLRRKNTPLSARLATFSHSFQRQSPLPAPRVLCPGQKAMICPILKRFLGHFFVNSARSSRLVSPSCRAYPAGRGNASIRRRILPNKRRMRWLPSQHQPVVPAVLDQSAARLHQPLLQAGQRPRTDSLRQHQPPPQVAQVVCDHAQPRSTAVGTCPHATNPNPYRKTLGRHYIHFFYSNAPRSLLPLSSPVEKKRAAEVSQRPATLLHEPKKLHRSANCGSSVSPRMVITLRDGQIDGGCGSRFRLPPRPYIRWEHPDPSQARIAPEGYLPAARR